MVAGCGTGNEIQLLASVNHGLAEIIGVDLSSTSIQIAQERIRHHRLHCCQARVGDLLDPGTLPAGPFDMISSYGVLHHTADPIKALTHLAERLAPEGVMIIMLYNRRGRMLIYHIREVLETLGIDRLATDQRISFVRDLLDSFTPGTLVAQYAKTARDYYRHDANIVDNFFHANDLAYDVGQIPEFLSEANLEFLDIIPGASPDAWDPTSVVSPSNRAFYNRFNQLSYIEQLSVLELLSPLKRSENIFWCCHAGARDFPTGFSPDWFRNSRWILNPLFIEHSKLIYLDQEIPFAKWVQNDPPSIPTTQLKLRWPLFPNSNTTAPLSRFQINSLLLPIATDPKTGAELLADHEHQSDHLLKLYEQWEKYRIVLRV